MSYRFPEILELLPKKDDCCSCGHCTCEVYAAELLAGRAAADACPDITAEAKRMLRQILAAEQEVVSAIKGISLTDVKEVAASLLMVPARAAGFLLVALPFAAVLWVLFAWMFMK